MTPIDHADIIRRTMATARAGQPMWFHMDNRSKLTGSPWNSQAANCVLTSIRFRFARFARTILLGSSSEILGSLSERCLPRPAPKSYRAITSWTPERRFLLPKILGLVHATTFQPGIAKLLLA